MTVEKNLENLKELVNTENSAGEIIETINTLSNNKNYCVLTINGEQMCKGLIDTGNSIIEKVAISSKLHRRLGVGYKEYLNQKVGTANKEAKVTKLGVSNCIKLKFMGLPKEYDVCPAVIEELSDDINIGIGFFAGVANNQKVSIDFEGRRNFVKLGKNRVEMITELRDEEGQVMSSNAQEVIQTLGLPTKLFTKSICDWYTSVLQSGTVDCA